MSPATASASVNNAVRSHCTRGGPKQVCIQGLFRLLYPRVIQRPLSMDRRNLAQLIMYWLYCLSVQCLLPPNHIAMGKVIKNFPKSAHLE